MYYSYVSKSASQEAHRISGEATELLTEVTKHGVYTAFSVDFETGEVEYVSPSYTFSIDKETGELKANGKAYTFEEDIHLIVTEWLAARGLSLEDMRASIDTNALAINTIRKDMTALTADIEDIYTNSFTNNDNGHLYRMVGEEKEWLNPPMAPGVEYRTAKLHDQKPIYTKLINYGYLKTANMYIGTKSVVSFYGVASVEKDGYAYKDNFPIFATGGTLLCIAYIRNEHLIIQAFDESISDYTAQFVIEYTKEED